jgi:hypothetical protein
VLRKVLKLDFDRVVPGTGPVVKRAELEAFADHIDKLAANPLPATHPIIGDGRQTAVKSQHTRS